MAQGDLKLRAVIESILEEKGFKDAQAALKRTQQSAKDAEGGFKGFRAEADALGYSVDNLKKMLLGGLGFGAVVGFLKSSFVEFARTERAFAAIEGQIRALGASANGTAPEVRAFINALSGQSGILDDDLIPAFNRLLLATGNVKASQEALQIATRFAANGFHTVQENSEALALAIQTGSVRSLSIFGIQTKDATGKALELGEGLGNLRVKFDTLAPSIDDAQDKINRLANAWDRLKDISGSAVNASLEVFARYSRSPLLQGLLTKATTDHTKAVEKGALDQVAAERKALAEREKMYADWDKAITANAEKRAAEQKRLQAQAVQDARALAGIREQVSREEIQNDIDAAEEGSADRVAAQLRLIEFDRKAALDRVILVKGTREDIARINALYNDQEREAVEQGVKDFQKGEDAKFQAAVERNEKLGRLAREQAEEERRAAIADERATSRGEIALLTAQQGAHQQYSKDWMEIERKKNELQLRDSVNAAQGNLSAQLAALQDYTNASKQLAADEANYRMQVAMQAMDMFAGALQAGFGQNKDVQIALTIMSTFAAAQRAFQWGLENGGPAGPYLGASAAAAALVAGFARVQAIENTEIGSSGSMTSGGSAAGSRRGASNTSGSRRTSTGGGFDDPVNDRAAEIGGQRWAQDAVRHFAEGVSRGWQEAMARAHFTAPSFELSTASSGGSGPTIIHHNASTDNRMTTFAPHTEVRLEGVIAATHTQLLKDLDRGLEKVRRTVIKKSRING